MVGNEETPIQAKGEKLLENESNSMLNPEDFGVFLYETRKRIIDAFLPLIIIEVMLDSQIESPTNIIQRISKEYNINISSGTVYPVFAKLRNQGLIRKRPKSTYYLLTEKGQSYAKNLPNQRRKLVTRSFVSNSEIIV